MWTLYSTSFTEISQMSNLNNKKSIQVVYAMGTFGNCLRWMFDRFTEGSNFKDIDSPWDQNYRAHGFETDLFNKKFIRTHQFDLTGRYNDSIDPNVDNVVVSFDPKYLLFVFRLGLYRNPGMENEERRYKHIIDCADVSFLQKAFGDVTSSKSVAKELVKIQFHDIENHTWWNRMNKIIANKNHHQFDLFSFWDQTQLKSELTKVAERYNLNFNIDEKVIQNVVEGTKKSYPVITRNRAHQVLDAIVSKSKIDCNDLDIFEQAFVEAELEKIHDSVIFPYGSQWFENTDQIREFLDTYPSYLKHMNPRLPWYNNIKNPFYLTGKIDE